MNNFTYKAKKNPTEIVVGTMRALTRQDAIDKLIAKGLSPLSVTQEVYDKKADKKKDFDIRAVRGVSLKEIIFFSRQLARLLKAGIPILKALSILSEQTKDQYFGKVVHDISERVRNGQTISSSLGEYKKIFSQFFISMLNAGELSGTLSLSLERISAHYTKKYELNAKIRSALVYPSLILVVGMLTLVFIFVNVVPRILPLLYNMNVELPLPTVLLISISDFFTGNWHWILLVLFIFGLIASRARKNMVFKYYFSIFKIKIPILGDLLVKSEIAQFANALSMALISGIPLISAVNISLPVISEYAIINGVKSHFGLIESGESLSHVLRKSKIFPDFACSLVAVGEESGDLSDSLGNLSDFYQADCDESVKIVTSLLEPIMVLTVGLVIGFIVMAVLLPILNLNVVTM